MKKPAGVGRRRARCASLISLAFSAQAMAVRRHGISMVVMMAVMAEALHFHFQN
jgi:hypothetical protein